MAVMKFSTSNYPSDFFDFNLKMLFYFGLWTEDDRPPFFKKLYRTYIFTLFIAAFIFVIITQIGLYQSRDDLLMFLANIDKAIVTNNYFLKIVIFYIKRKQLRVLITEILHSGDRIDNKGKKLMVIYFVVIFCMLATVTAAFQAAAFSQGELIVDAWLPFDPKKNSFSLLLAGQILGLLFGVPVFSRAIAIQGIVCSIIMYMCDQLMELQRRLKALTFCKENESEFREEFKDIIKKHIRLIGYSQSFDSMFKEYFLVQNLAVTVELCLNALIVSIIDNSHKDHLISFFAFLGLALFNAYVFCYLGNELMDQSEGIALAAYESTWTSWPVDLQKDLLVVITVAQRSLKLSAGGIAYMSMETYALALYNGYSMYAVLRDVMN